MARQLSDDGHRAAYVAWLLGIDPSDIFPFGPECSDDADEYLAFAVRAALIRRMRGPRARSDGTREGNRYVATLAHADRVLNGTERPPASGFFESHAAYRLVPFLSDRGV